MKESKFMNKYGFLVVIAVVIVFFCSTKDDWLSRDFVQIVIHLEFLFVIIDICLTSRKYGVLYFKVFMLCFT